MSDQPRDEHGQYVSSASMDDAIRAGAGLTVTVPIEAPTRAVDGLEGGVRPAREAASAGDTIDALIRSRGGRGTPQSLGRAGNGLEILTGD